MGCCHSSMVVLARADPVHRKPAALDCCQPDLMIDYDTLLCMYLYAGVHMLQVRTAPHEARVPHLS